MNDQSDTHERGTKHWKDQDKCQGCGAPKEQEPLRAILLTSGEKDLLCVECFVEANNDGRVSPDDPRVNDDGSIELGIPRAPGQRGGPRE